MNKKYKYNHKNFTNLYPNKIEVKDYKAESWRLSSSGEMWYRPLVETFYKCERLSMCAFIEKDGEGYRGACIGSEEVFKSPDIDSLKCTLDLILVREGIDVLKLFGRE